MSVRQGSPAQNSELVRNLDHLEKAIAALQLAHKMKGSCCQCGRRHFSKLEELICALAPRLSCGITGFTAAVLASTRTSSQS